MTLSSDKEANMVNQCWKYKREIMYLLFGGLTTLVNVFTYFVLVRLAGIEYLGSNAMAWVTSVTFAYITNRIYVFACQSGGWIRILKEFCTFIGCRLFSGMADTTAMYLLIDLLGYNDLPVKIFANILVIILNYGLSRQIVFHDNGQGEVSV